ncbi:MAG: ATPase [Paludibacter sp.]|nr:ATPase [Paludibacter sp.]
MILIADSGSTKTNWCLTENSVILKHIFTKGISPFYQTEEEIVRELEVSLIPFLKGVKIDQIFFYGTGCSFPDKIAIVSGALGWHFKNVSIEVQSDLLGAARSLFLSTKGIACILGTGSNSCLYDGTEIVENISPLGFILGDEGSGAVLGKILIADCLKNQLPEALKDKLLASYELNAQMILENVYKKPFPNRFLAKLTPFLLENITEPSIYKIVYDSFDAFFLRNVMQYPLENVQVGFVGSIAHYFGDILKVVASKRGITISQVVQNPMDGLVKYHSN